MDDAMRTMLLRNDSSTTTDILESLTSGYSHYDFAVRLWDGTTGEPENCRDLLLCSNTPAR
jgi:hypothetical protein